MGVHLMVADKYSDSACWMGNYNVDRLAGRRHTRAAKECTDWLWHIHHQECTMIHSTFVIATAD